MRVLRFLGIVVFACFGLITAATAQEDDKGWLTRTIQDALSGAGRAVSIDGFRGALSSSASFDRMTIADDDGVWLTLEDVVLDWNRSALLRGRLEVQSLTAARLDLPRLPAGEEETLPDAEAKPFSLPDLPVSIEIADFSVGEINLGKPILGEAAQLSVTANARLTDQVGIVDFVARRTDGKRGEFAIKADYQRGDNVLDLLLNLSEEADGITARLLNLPDRPSVEMVVEGQGPLDDFTSDVTIATDGRERLAGEIVLGTQAPRRASDQPDRRIRADISGDITALLAPRYRDFFGDNVALRLDALREANGALEVSDFALSAQAAELAGRVTLNQDGWPSFIDVDGEIVNPDGTRVLLPVSGGATTVERMGLSVDYDAADGDAFAARFDIAELETDGVSIAETELALLGTLQGDVGAIGRFAGDVTFDTAGLELSDPASAAALGDAVSGSAQIEFVEGSPLAISELELAGTDYGLTGAAEIDGFDTGFLTQLQMTLTARDLSRFSALAGRELSGQTALALEGQVTPLGGMFDIAASGQARDLKLGIAQADAVLEGVTQVDLIARRNENGTFLRDFKLENAALLATGSAELRSNDSSVDFMAKLEDVGLVLPQYEGPITVTAKAVQDDRGWSVDAETDGPYDARLTAKGLATGPNAVISFTADVPEVSNFAPDVPQLTGPITAEGMLSREGDGYVIEADASGPQGVTARLDGAVTPQVALDFDLRLPDVNPFVPQLDGPLRARGALMQKDDAFLVDAIVDGPLDAQAAIKGEISPTLALSYDVTLPEVNALVPQVNGPLRATGSLAQTSQGLAIETQATGPYATRVEVQGLLSPALDLAFDLRMPDVNPVFPQARGPLQAAGQLQQRDGGLYVDASASGPHGLSAKVQGMATGPDVALDFDLSAPNVAPFAPGVNGPLRASGAMRQTADGVVLDADVNGPYGSSASVDGLVTGPNAAVDYALSLPDVGVFIDEINGPLSLDGSARKQGTAWRVDTDVAGPSGTQATVNGLVNADGTLALDLAGSAPLALTEPFIAPRSLQGLVRFDLSVNGPPEIASLSGRITTSNASFAAPNLRVTLEAINATVEIANNRAQITGSARPSDGGELRLGGSVTLTPALPADLQVGLRNVVLIDPNELYRTELAGDLRIAGPLSGGATISGAVNIGETNITVPSTGLTSIGDIPPITHVGDSAAVEATRRKARIEDANAPASQAEAEAAGPLYTLDVTINAPNRIFVRGRGLDAELGGTLRLTGTTRQIISAGRFALIRGRLDILGKRFDLREGSVQFEGDFIPFIRFVSVTDTRTGEVRVIVQGPADSPEVLFESTPDAPQDEVLAQLLFGRNISEISPLQALQLASAVATLAGRGGGGIISNLREGFGLDDLDVTTTEDGGTAIRAGKYLSENIYIDVTAGSDGTGEVSLNLDLTPDLTAKGTLGSDGDSGIGIFFERDY